MGPKSYPQALNLCCAFEFCLVTFQMLLSFPSLKGEGITRTSKNFVAKKTVTVSTLFILNSWPSQTECSVSPG